MCFGRRALRSSLTWGPVLMPCGTIMTIGIAWLSAALVGFEPGAGMRIRTNINHEGGGLVRDDSEMIIAAARGLSGLRICQVHRRAYEEDLISDLLLEILPEDDHDGVGVFHVYLPPSWEKVADRESEISEVWYRPYLEELAVRQSSGGAAPDPAPLQMPSWSVPDLGYDEQQRAFWLLQMDDAHGWPCLALRSRLRLAPLAASAGDCLAELRFGVPVSTEQRAPNGYWRPLPPSASSMPWARWRFLPLRPIWPGLVIDIVFWTGALWLSLLGVRTCRHWTRRRRGACPACGYVLRGLDDDGCPECGWRR